MQTEIVHSSIENTPITWVLWTPSETEEELLRLWESMKSDDVMPVLKAPHRRCEWLGTRILLNRLNLGRLDFLPNGKPVIASGGVSISHCKGSVAVATSDANIGLDIQLPTEQIFIIRSKFCSTTEWSWLKAHEETLRALTIVWSAKEAIFKYWGEHVEFAEDIELLPFRCDDSTIKAHYKGVHGKREFNLWHTTRDMMEVVIAV
jgi:phosphopantetheinyl transferase